jgi:hypothetical protein
MEINRHAPIVARHEITINAPLQTVWQLQSGIAGWPNWNPDIRRAELTGPLAAGTVFHWETAGLAISSTLGEIVPLEKLAWSGGTGGILAIHVWIFSADAAGTEVRTEESWEGVSLPSRTQDIQAALDASLVRWLSFLKVRAENFGPPSLNGRVVLT